MIKNYYKIVVRYLLRNKLFTIINVLGMAIGIASSYLVLIYVFDELNYDKAFKDYQNIYRLGIKLKMNDKITDIATSMYPLCNTLRKDFKEVEDAVRVRKSREVQISFGKNKFTEKKILFGDSTFFNIFDYKLLKGNAYSVLINPFSVVISEETAKKYFGKDEPVGKTLRWNNQYDFLVTGVFKKFKYNTHLKFDLIFSFSSLPKISSYYDTSWLGGLNLYNYVKLKPGTDTIAFKKNLEKMVEKHIGTELNKMNIELTFLPQKISDIHLYSKKFGETEKGSDIAYIYIFSGIAVLILLLACINFMNLAIAQSFSRHKEIGLRKIFGSHKRNIVFQFLAESVFFSFVSLFFALVLIELFFPVFNKLFDKNLQPDYYWKYFFILLLVTILAGIISGLYPAKIFASFVPSRAIKATRFKYASKRTFFRSSLVIFQFVISEILIISSLLVYLQLQFLMNKNLGFNKNELIVIQMRDKEHRTNPEKIKARLDSVPGVISSTATENYLGNITNQTSFHVEDYAWEKPVLLSVNDVDYNFANTLGLTLINGRFFLKENKVDTLSAVVNESAVKLFGWKDPIGKKIRFVDDRSLNVIGVLNDFNYGSLHEKVQPLVLTNKAFISNYILIKVQRQNITQTLNLLQKKWGEINPGKPFEYFFQDRIFNDLYQSDRRLGYIFAYFTILALIIAGMGLFGLAAYMTEQRTKEIGIRKTLGASIGSIIFELTKQFSRWVFISSTISAPIAWILMNKWLQNFAYHIEIPVWVFFASLIATLLIALITVAYQAYKTATVNPIISLRYE